MSKPKEIEDIWNSVRDKESGDAEYSQADPDFKAKLGHAASEARQGRSTDIAGLEKFEQAVAKDAGVALSSSGVDAARVNTPGTPTVFGSGRETVKAADGAEKGAKPTAKGSGAQKEGKVSEKEKALKDAEGANKKVESDDVNSPDFPSAARPLAAEVAGSHPEKKAANTPKKASAKKAGHK